MRNDNIINTNSNLDDNIDEVKINFNKIIIPYDFKLNKYNISDEELQGFEHKQLLLNQLYEFNTLNLFKYEIPYKPSCIQKFFIILITGIIMVALLYACFLAILLCGLNPFIIYCSWKLLHFTFSFCKSIIRRIYGSCKKKKINSKLKEKNKSQFFVENNLSWNLGLSGYWLEFEKKASSSTELENKIN